MPPGYRYTPTVSDDDMVLPRLRRFINELAQDVIKSANSPEDAQAAVTEVLRSHQHYLDRAYNALVEMIRHPAIGVPDNLARRLSSASTAVARTPRSGDLGVSPSTPDDANISPTVDPSLATASNAERPPSDPQDSSAAGSENEPDGTRNRGIRDIGLPRYTWADLTRVGIARAAARSVSAPTDMATNSLQRNGGQDSTQVTGNGAHAVTGGTVDGPSVAHTPGRTMARHWLALPLIIDSGVPVRLQTTGGLDLPRYRESSPESDDR